ncbi:hypothetical protein Leryth_013895 [Lithospermum erythrorhizon]|nr:hypothetical protein Leryth_013895 [Lithospermum erythrorhizon]
MMPIASEEHQEPQQLETCTHNPSAPSHELFDISTAVDPSYIISLIRKLIPSNAKNESVLSREGKYETTGECTLSNEKNENGVSQIENCEARDGSCSEVEGMDTVDAVNDDNGRERMENGLQHNHESDDRSVEGDAWEEYGCTLWDLAASETHAELMVQNLILEVLLTNVRCSRSARITEICLGILGNLACHEVPQKQITSTNGLVETILDQLFSDDAPCLREALRLITLCLQGAESVLWANALKSELIISRILWISENALNLQLLEKSVGLFSAIAESSQEVTFVLLPPLFNLGLPNILISLLDFEMSTLTREKDSERYSILDFILRTIEALSTLDDYSQQICVRKDLFQLLNALIKLPDKLEVAGSCISAAVLLANILTDAPDLGLEASQDIHFLQGLFEIFPLACDDAEAQSALWSILARLLCQVKEGEMNFVRLHQYASVLASKSELIEEELLNHNSDPKEADEHPNNITTRKAILLAVSFSVTLFHAHKNDFVSGKIISVFVSLYLTLS